MLRLLSPKTPERGCSVAERNATHAEFSVETNSLDGFLHHCIPQASMRNPRLVGHPLDVLQLSGRPAGAASFCRSSRNCGFNHSVTTVPSVREFFRHLDIIIFLHHDGSVRLAAFALEYRGTVHTADTDFQRFSGVSWFNPITGAAG
jgi:hypothetical protein